MTTPSIAVCVVFYNKAGLTSRCIESVVNADVPLYVLNNNSESAAGQAVAELCSQWLHITYLESAINLGPAGGRNLLIDASKEDWLLFIDNDITLETQDWPSKLLAYIHDFPDAEAISLSIINGWDKSVVRPVKLVVVDGEAHFETVTDGCSNVFPGGGTAIRRTLFDRLGKYDKSFWAFEEAELALRAIAKDRPIRVRLTDGIRLLHHHDFVKDKVDRRTVRERYSVSRLGQAQQEIERRYHVVFERQYARWARAQTRDHLVTPWLRSIERYAWKIMSRIRRAEFSWWSRK